MNLSSLPPWVEEDLRAASDLNGHELLQAATPWEKKMSFDLEQGGWGDVWLKRNLKQEVNLVDISVG